jgi:hypothetical protein
VFYVACYLSSFDKGEISMAVRSAIRRVTLFITILALIIPNSVSAKENEETMIQKLLAEEAVHDELLHPLLEGPNRNINNNTDLLEKKRYVGQSIEDETKSDLIYLKEKIEEYYSFFSNHSEDVESYSEKTAVFYNYVEKLSIYLENSELQSEIVQYRKKISDKINFTDIKAIMDLIQNNIETLTEQNESKSMMKSSSLENSFLSTFNSFQTLDPEFMYNLTEYYYALFQFTPTSTGYYYMSTSPIHYKHFSDDDMYSGEDAIYSFYPEDTIIEVFSDSQLTKWVFFNDDDPSRPGFYSTVEGTLTAGKTYYIKIRSFGNRGFFDNTQFILSTSDLLFSGMYKEMYLYSNSSKTFVFRPRRPLEDFYAAFTSPVPDRFFDNYEADTVLQIYDENYQLLYSNDDSEGKYSQIIFRHTGSSEYFLVVRNKKPTPSTFRLTVSSVLRPINVGTPTDIVVKYDLWFRFIPKTTGVHRIYTSNYQNVNSPRPKGNISLCLWNKLLDDWTKCEYSQNPVIEEYFYEGEPYILELQNFNNDILETQLFIQPPPTQLTSSVTTAKLERFERGQYYFTINSPGHYLINISRIPNEGSNSFLSLFYNVYTDPLFSSQYNFCSHFVVPFPEDIDTDESMELGLKCMFIQPGTYYFEIFNEEERTFKALLSVDRAPTNIPIQTYIYDSLGRLEEIRFGTMRKKFEYDLNGNLLHVEIIQN